MENKNFTSIQKMPLLIEGEAQQSWVVQIDSSLEESSVKQFSKVMKNTKGAISTQNCDMALHRDLRRELSNVVVKSILEGGNSMMDESLDGQQDQELKKEFESLRKLGFQMNRKNRGYRTLLHRWLSPFDLLPSCLGILRGSKINNLLEANYGIGKSSREGSYVMEWENGPANTKLMIMYSQLYKQQRWGKSNAYWATIERLFKMKEFWVACLNVVFPSWETNKKYEEVIEWVEGAKELATTPTQQLPNMDSKRVYIQKRKTEPLGEGNVRPLGVPSPVWRIYLRGLNNAVMFWNKGKLSNQYAYQVGKDVTDAWVQILNQLDQQEHCYEFDLTGFFDNVTHAGIQQELTTLKFPKEIIERLIKLSQNIPKFGKPEEDLMSEPDRKIRYLPNGEDNPGFVDSSESVDYKLIGVPQGGAISCGLAILANRQSALPLICEKTGLVRLINYFADDGIINSNRPISPGDVNDEFRGLRENISKGRTVKSSNLPLEEIKLKFLGLLLEKGKFSGSSRSGSSLQLEEKHYVYSWAKSHYNDIVKSICLIHLEKEKAEKVVWELFKTPDDLSSLFNRSSVDGEKNSEIEVKINKIKHRVWLPFRLLSERIKSEGYSLSEETDIIKYLAKVGKSLYDKKSFKQSLVHLLDSPEGGAIVSRLYSGSWEVPVEEDKEIQEVRGSWKRKRLGEYLRKHRSQMVWKLPEKLGELHSQSHKTLKELFKRVIPNEQGIAKDYVGITLENSSSFGCRDLLLQLKQKAEDRESDREGRITFYVAPPKTKKKRKESFAEDKTNKQENPGWKTLT